jgi:alkaline phosphatase D
MATVRRRDFLHAALAASGGVALGCGPERPASIPPFGGPPPHPSSVLALPEPMASASAAPAQAPAIVTAEAARPQIPYGVQSGDVTESSAMIWSRADRPAKMVVEWSTRDSLASPTVVPGPVAGPDGDFTARMDLGGLPPGQRIFYRVTFEDLDTGRTRSEPALGSFLTAPDLAGARTDDVFFLWSGDTAGQGWGINLAWGGMKIYEAMRRMAPDFFIHCGDLIYGDMPIPPQIKLPDGSIWTNLTTPEKSKVAETLAEYRGNFAYNLLDRNVRRFNAEVPSLVMWDDHETHDNWFPDEIFDRDRRYTEKRASALSANGHRAMFEYTPIRPSPVEARRIYRSFHRGPSLDVILLDERTYKAPNSDNLQPTASLATAFLGGAQLAWLKQTLLQSTALWKVIATDQPLGLVIGDGVRGGRRRFDAWANGKRGPPLGRELELAEILRFIKEKRIKNVVWLTADVHYAAAHHYDPSRAAFTDFNPFWEFVAGPLHASTYGPNALDSTFGPEVRWASPASGRRLRSPADGGQYFGGVRIDGRSGVMTVRLHDLTGTKLHEIDLPPSR